MSTVEYKVQKLVDALGGFQKFYLHPPELQRHIRLKEESIDGTGEWDKWVLIHLREEKKAAGAELEIRAQVGIIGRLCASRVIEAADSIRCDMRVWKLFPPSESNDGLQPQEQDKDRNDKVEFCLARHVVRLQRKFGNTFTPGAGLGHGYKCTSDDISLLRVGCLETMEVSVIFNSSAPQEPFNTSLEFLLAEKVRDILEANAIVVSKDAFIDVRQCPLAMSSFSLPPIAYLYIENCQVTHKASSSTSGSQVQAGKVNFRTRVVIKSKQTRDVNYYVRVFESTVPSSVSLAGLEAPIRFLERMMRMQKEMKLGEEDVGHFDVNFSHGFLIAGSAGCGKGAVVREAAKKLRANLLVLNLADRDFSIQDVRRFGDSVTKVFSAAVTTARRGPTILLMEQLEVLSVAEGKCAESSTALAKAKLVNHLCELFDAIPTNACLSVILTTNKPHLIPPKLRRAGRLQHELYIKVPNAPERQRIIESITGTLPAFNNYDLSKLALETPGYTGADLERLIHLIALRANEEGMRQVCDVDVKYGLSRVLPSLLQGSLGVVGLGTGTGSSLDDISGLRSVKLDLIKGIVWPLKYPHAFLTMAIHPPKGILLYGPPGCAKTSLVRAVAGSHGTNFLCVSAAELFASGVGESEKIISDLFHRARAASPSVLFIDELEAIVGSRQSSSKGKSMNETILSTFLTEMDGIGTHAPVSSAIHKDKQTSNRILDTPRVVVVAATNRPDLIDSALLRPGRLDRIIPVPPPNEAERLELLLKLTEGRMPLGKDVDLTQIAQRTERYSGADLVSLCKEAALFALEGDMEADFVGMENFMRALAQSSPSISPQTLADFIAYQKQTESQSSSSSSS